MVRAPFYDKNGLKKGAWSREEDERLRAFIQRYGHSNWRQLPRLAGLARCGKSCRLRWLNYLRPNLKHGNYTQEEEELIIKLHQQLGNRWSQIAEKLPGRTDNEVKNYWHGHLKKFSRSNNEISASSSESLKSNPGNNTPEEEEKTNNQFTESESPPLFDEDGANNFHHVLESPLFMSSEELGPYTQGQNYALVSTNVEQYSSMNCPRPEEDGVVPLLTFGDFWTEPFLVETSAYANDEILSGGEGMGFLIPYLFYEATDFYF